MTTQEKYAFLNKLISERELMNELISKTSKEIIEEISPYKKGQETTVMGSFCTGQRGKIITVTGPLYAGLLELRAYAYVLHAGEEKTTVWTEKQDPLLQEALNKLNPPS